MENKDPSLWHSVAMIQGVVAVPVAPAAAFAFNCCKYLNAWWSSVMCFGWGWLWKGLANAGRDGGVETNVSTEI